MKVWLNDRLAEPIISALQGVRNELGPKLCCEVGGVNPDAAARELLEAVRSWGRDLVICIVPHGARHRVLAASMDALREDLEHRTVCLPSPETRCPTARRVLDFGLCDVYQHASAPNSARAPLATDIGLRARSGKLFGALGERLMKEDVVSIVDPVSVGGISVDFTPETNGTVEVLVAGWGAHEEVASTLDAQLGGDGVFRGN